MKSDQSPYAPPGSGSGLLSAERSAAEPPSAGAPASAGLASILQEVYLQAGGNPHLWRTIEEAAAGGGSWVAKILESNAVDETAFLQGLAFRLSLPWQETIPPATELPQNILPARIALKHQILPLAREGDRLRVGLSDPFHHGMRAVLAQQLDGAVEYCLVPRSALLATLQTLYGVGAETLEQLVEGREAEGTQQEEDEVNIIDEDDAEASVMKFVNQIMREALKQRATDIHVEPIGDQLTIRYRIDGMLREVPIPANIRLLRDSVISRIKIMSNLDIAEKRLPQDGRINLELAGQAIDVRVATIPSVAGETISLRLLGQERFDFPRLGLDPASEAVVRDLISMPNGIILVTGPTGCGKSTSLYTFLSSLNTKDRRIVTIEDPVEHKLPGVVQIAVKSEIGLTFARALRSILRGDPNVIMVGEMRDFETAEIAIRAALTGHLVFSTLHTNDSVGGITRLLDMGVEPFLVGTAVRVFVAQRLVRRLCPHCRVPDEHGAQYLQDHQIVVPASALICRPHGCKQCHQSGYSGRTALFEICRITPAMQELIQNKAPAVAMKRLAVEEGMLPLRQQGWRRVFDGTTSVEEVLRVTAAEMSLVDE